jgi:hypothetical protein
MQYAMRKKWQRNSAYGTDRHVIGTKGPLVQVQNVLFADDIPKERGMNRMEADIL